jgi:ectoine hydroxylase-related dioxygenase (phytanoyl-CoA dioxygenase family)
VYEIDAHPWNTAFTWRTNDGATLRRVSKADATQFDQRGFFVLHDLIAPGVVSRILEEIDAAEAAVEAFLESRPEGRMSIAEAGAISFTTHLVTRSDFLRELASSPPFADIAHDLVGPGARLYWDQAVYKKPEKPRRFPWHQDNGYNFVEPQQYLTVWLALTDASETNGCPWVVPGLHRHGTLRHRYVDPLGFECFPDHPDKVAASVPAGGAVVFSSLTPHLTGPNTTDAVRKAYILQYAPDGATVMKGDPDAGPPASAEPANDPARQFTVA